MTTPLRTLARLVFAVVLVALAAACGSLKDEADFQKQLATEFRTPDSHINLKNGSLLTITLYNSPLANPPSEAKRETCRRVAEFVRDHYRGYKYVQAVQVAFGTRRGGVTVTSSSTECRFTVRELGSAPAQS